jgi:hypothetical protein
MTANLIDRSWEVYEQHQRKRGVQSDELSFVGGFMSCYGVITGRVDVGLADGTTVLETLRYIQRELDGYRAEVMRAQAEQRKLGD